MIARALAIALLTAISAPVAAQEAEASAPAEPATEPVALDRGICAAAARPRCQEVARRTAADHAIRDCVSVSLVGVARLADPAVELHALSLLHDARLDILVSEEIEFRDAPDRLPEVLAPGGPGLAPVIRYPAPTI